MRLLNRNKISRLFAYVACVLLCTTAFSAEKNLQYDVVIYGGTSAAVTTAVQVKKMGKTVVIVSPDRHLGGLSSGGLGFTDSGNTATVGGLSREFYQRVYSAYQDEKSWPWQPKQEYNRTGHGVIHGDKTMWIFEPHVAEKVFDDWIKEWNIPVFRNAWLDRKSGVKKDGSRILSLTTLCGKTFSGRVFVDTTYEGDLMAAAGVDYHVGREANSVYGETRNGNQFKFLGHVHFFHKPVDPYIVPGDPSSGLLKYIGNSKPGIQGEGDHRVQAYCFRMCLTDHEPNRVPFPKPEGYDPMDYELLVRVFESGWNEPFEKFDRIPNRKTDTNNHGPFSTDFIGMNYDYPDASYERRKEIIAEHERYQKGLMYFLANDPRVPEYVRKPMSRWGLAKDEFIDNENWPHQLYVREARRMIGEYVMTEQNCLTDRTCPKPVGQGSYNLDSHNVRRYVTDKGFVQNEGDYVQPLRSPYAIDYGSLLPKRDQCNNLLIPVCVSCSHIAFGSIRMEPVFMILGQSAGTAAAMSIDEQTDLHDLDYEKLKNRLVADGQRLGSAPNRGIDAKSLDGYIIDDLQATVTGEWESSRSVSGFAEKNYLHDKNADKGNKSVEYSVELPKTGKYDVRISYSAEPNRSGEVPVKIIHQNGDVTIKVDQRRKPSGDEVFHSLGIFAFDKTAKVIISTGNTQGYVIADAVQFIEIKD